MKNNIATITTLSLAGITACTGLILTGSYVSAEDIVDDIFIEVPTSCSMSGSGMNTHTAEIANGTYQANIGTTTITALCNDNAGFSIYAAGYTGETIGQTNSNKLVGTNASSNATIDTGTATSAGNPDVSNWAMKLATDSQATYPLTLSTGYNAYHAVPNEYTKVATRLTGTDTGTSAVGSTLTTTYAAYISKTQAADTYSGKVKYTLVHPNDGAAPEPPATPGSFGAAFAAAGKTKYNGYYKMQDIDQSICSNVTLRDNASATQLIDSRDDKIYYVARLQDGNCWMTQNLDFNIDSNTTLSSLDTNLITFNNSGGIYSTSDGYSQNDNIIYYTPSNSTAVVNSGNYGSVSLTTGSTDVGDWYYTDQNRISSQANYLNGSGSNYFSNSAFSGNGPHGHVGNYYDFNSAIASNLEDYYEGSIYRNSICPANWELPNTPNTSFAGNYKMVPELLTQSDYYGLTYYYNDGGLYGGYGLENAPTFFTRAGTVSGNALKNAGYDGYYWGNSYAETYSYIYPSNGYNDGSFYSGRELMIRSTAIDPLNTYNPQRQRSIRCIVHDTNSISYNFTKIWFSPNGNYDYYQEGPMGYILSWQNLNDYESHSDSTTDSNNEEIFWQQLMRRGGTVKLAPNKFTYEGYTFTGWNTAPDGSGISYADGADFTSGTNEESLILYAQWTQN